MSAVSVSEITAPFRPLLDYSSLSLYALSAMIVPFRPTSFRPTSSRPTPSRLRPLRDYSSRVQKPRFCARNARKRGLRRVKAHKNADFVLERGQNLGKVALSDTKTPILCSKAPKIGVLKGKSAQKPRFCAREEGDWHQGERKLASGSITMVFLQITAHALKT